MMLRARCGIIRLAAFVLLAAFSGPGLAQDEAALRAERAMGVFADWLDDQNTKGTLALVHNGVLVAEQGFGMDAAKPMELASVSKTITGVCAAQLVEAGVLGWETRYERGTLAVKLGDLVTHQSGLEVDSTQTSMGSWLDQKRQHRSRDVADAVIERQGAHPIEASPFHYNNENFALAALVIEAATRRGTYLETCSDLAIAPAGVSAAPSPRSAAFLPWGGWQMSAGALALWHAHWFAGDTALARKPEAFPHATVDKGLFYGLGTNFRRLDRGNTFWHFGALCFPGKLEAGSYVASVFGEWTVAALWESCVDWPAMLAVDVGIWGAIYGALE